MLKNFKKGFITLLSVSLITTYLLPGIADAQEVTSAEDKPTNTSLYNLDKGYSLTKQELSDLDNLVLVKDSELEAKGLGIGAVLGIIGSVIGLGGSLYAGGRYAARQVEVRLGLTSSEYKKNRNYFRIGITAAFGPALALGFDDYFYGI